METKEPKKKRMLWIDILNIVAILGVCMMHTNYAQNCYNGNLNFPFVWGVAVHSFYNWPVPVFFMLTGCNLIGRTELGGVKKYINRRLTKSVYPFIAWSIIYYALFSRTTNWIEFIDLFIHAKFVAIMWFFIPLFAIYLSIPFMEKFVVNSSRKMIEYFLFISFLSTSLFPFLCSFINIDFIPIFPMATSYLWMAVLGYYVKNYDFTASTRNKVYKLGILAVVVNFIGYIALNYIKGIPDTTFEDNKTPTCIIIAFAIFLWFKSHDWSFLEKYTTTISYISSCTLGIYVIHKLIKTVAHVIYPNLIDDYIFITIGFIPLYLFSLICVMLMKRIPLIKRIVP